MSFQSGVSILTEPTDVGYLHFSYYGVAMTLLRRLIRSTALGPPCSDHAILADIRQRALQIAQGAISFVSELRPDHLEAFWYYSMSSTSRFALQNTKPSRSHAIFVLASRLFHHALARHVAFVPRAQFLARNTQFISLEATNDEQKQRAHAVRRQQTRGCHPSRTRARSCCQHRRASRR